MLRYQATIVKFVGSIPIKVNGFLIGLIILAGTIALGRTHALTNMNTRNLCEQWVASMTLHNLTTICEPNSYENVEASKSHSPTEAPWPVTLTALPFHF